MFESLVLFCSIQEKESLEKPSLILMTHREFPAINIATEYGVPIHPGLSYYVYPKLPRVP